MKCKFFVLLLYFVAASVMAQPMNIEVLSEKGTPQLTGKINKEGLSSNSYASWFVKNHEAYVVNSEPLNSITGELGEYTIEIFMGTWCGDSKREVPRFYKVLEKVDFPFQRLTTIGVGRDRPNYKQSPGGEHIGKNIHRVPTFIFYKNGVEVNRIVESPVESLEKDIERILNGDYISNYSAVAYLDDVLKQKGLEFIQKNKDELSTELERLVANMNELNTYSFVLFTSNREEEAIAVARLNTRLFPKEAYVYLSLGKKLAEMDRTEEALTIYHSGLMLEPDNQEIIDAIAELQD